MTTPKPNPNWRETLDTREQEELRLAQYYATFFHHGTTGHLRLMLINKLAILIDTLSAPDTETAA